MLPLSLSDRRLRHKAPFAGLGRGKHMELAGSTNKAVAIIGLNMTVGIGIVGLLYHKYAVSRFPRHYVSPVIIQPEDNAKT
jgi:hypothetical protein